MQNRKMAVQLANELIDSFNTVKNSTEYARMKKGRASNIVGAKEASYNRFLNSKVANDYDSVLIRLFSFLSSEFPTPQNTDDLEIVQSFFDNVINNKSAAFTISIALVNDDIDTIPDLCFTMAIFRYLLDNKIDHNMLSYVLIYDLYSLIISGEFKKIKDAGDSVPAWAFTYGNPSLNKSNKISVQRFMQTAYLVSPDGQTRYIVYSREEQENTMFLTCVKEGNTQEIVVFSETDFDLDISKFWGIIGIN